MKEGAYIATEKQKAMLRAVMWDADGHRLADTVAISPQKLAERAGFQIEPDRKFIVVQGDGIGKQYPFSSEKLTTLLAIYKYTGFDNALKMMKAIYEVGGKGHSCGIYSFTKTTFTRSPLRRPLAGLWCGSLNPRRMQCF